MKTLNLTNFVTTQADVAYLFSNANSLVNIISDSTTPSALRDETFKSLPTLGSCMLSIPKEAEDTYKSVKGWRDLF